MKKHFKSNPMKKYAIEVTLRKTVSATFKDSVENSISYFKFIFLKSMVFCHYEHEFEEIAGWNFLKL